MSRVLVTGGGGFLGSHLVERLEADGHDVFVARSRDYDLTRFDDAEPHVHRRAARARLPPRGRGRRDRRKPREPGPLLVREPDDGRARARTGASPRGPQARDRGHRLRLPEVHAGAVLGGRPVERLPGGDERALRRREEVDPRRRASVSRAVRARRDLPAAGEPLRAARQLRPRLVARDSGVDPQDARGRRRGHALGRRLADAGVSVRRRLRRGAGARGGTLRRAGAGEHRHGCRDLDSRGRRDDRRTDRLRGRDHLGHVDAERPAAPQPRCLARRDLFGFEARTSLRAGLERTIAWYRSSAAVSA